MLTYLIPVVAGFERIDATFERSSTIGKTLIKLVQYAGKAAFKRKRGSIRQTLLLSYFKKLPRPLQSAAESRLSAWTMLVASDGFTG